MAYDGIRNTSAAWSDALAHDSAGVRIPSRPLLRKGMQMSAVATLAIKYPSGPPFAMKDGETILKQYHAQAQDDNVSIPPQMRHASSAQPAIQRSPFSLGNSSLHFQFLI